MTLAKLPDRTPVRITAALLSELNQALRQYAAYREAYGEAESVAELIAFLLDGAPPDPDRRTAAYCHGGLRVRVYGPSISLSL